MRLLPAGLALLLCACASGPTPHDWEISASISLREFERAYLAGNTRVAEAEFARARRELSATGRAGLVASAELLRCAVRTASVEFDDCPGFTVLAVDAGAAERAYADYLGGRWAGLDPKLLPESQRSVLGGNGDRLPESQSPLSSLVAAGALLRAGRIAPQGIAAAVELASANGWRRPLLAWLRVEEKRVQAGGDAQALARIRRRIALVEEGPAPVPNSH